MRVEDKQMILDVAEQEVRDCRIPLHGSEGMIPLEDIEEFFEELRQYSRYSKSKEAVDILLTV